MVFPVRCKTKYYPKIMCHFFRCIYLLLKYTRFQKKKVVFVYFCYPVCLLYHLVGHLKGKHVKRYLPKAKRLTSCNQQYL